MTSAPQSFRLQCEDIAIYKVYLISREQSVLAVEAFISEQINDLKAGLYSVLFSITDTDGAQAQL